MIYVILANGFEEIEAITPIDFLRRADIQVAVCGLGGKIITGGHGVAVETDMLFEDIDADKADMLILPGGKAGVDNMVADGRVAPLCADILARGAYLAMICAAPSLAGRAGLLKGRKATCYPGFGKFLEGALYQPDANVVADGKIITAKAAGASMEFAHTLCAILAGKETADKVAAAMFARV